MLAFKSHATFTESSANVSRAAGTVKEMNDVTVASAETGCAPVADCHRLGCNCGGMPLRLRLKLLRRLVPKEQPRQLQTR